MYPGSPSGRRVFASLSGGQGPLPPDIWFLLGVVFLTYSLQFFATTQAIPGLLRLTPLVWQVGFVWQLLTYPFAGAGGASLWIIIELLILFWFSRDVFSMLHRRRFWQLLVTAAAGAALVAVVVELITRLLTGAAAGVVPFTLMQGQRMLIVIAIAAFATLRRDATILLFFVLPIQAKYFLGLEILFAFIAFLGYHDFAGFLGVCTAVGITYSLLTRTRLRGVLREGRLRLERWLIQLKLARLRRRRGLRVVKGEGGGSGGSQGGDPWVH